MLPISGWKKSIWKVDTNVSDDYNQLDVLEIQNATLDVD